MLIRLIFQTINLSKIRLHVKEADQDQQEGQLILKLQILDLNFKDTKLL